MGIDFSEIKKRMSSYHDSSHPVVTYHARDDAERYYALYLPEAHTSSCLIFIHGSSATHVYLESLAKKITEESGVAMCTPTLRGHGEPKEKRGDIAYTLQLEDDLIDLVENLKKKGFSRFFVGGHSSGGGFAARVLADDRTRNMFSGGILCAPMLGPFSPTSRKDFGTWAKPNMPVMLTGLALEWFGLHWMDRHEAITFSVPDNFCDDSTCGYSFCLYRGMHALNLFGKDLKKVRVPILVVVGDRDEVFVPEAYDPLLKRCSVDGHTEIISNSTHIGFLYDERTYRVMADWLKSRN